MCKPESATKTPEMLASAARHHMAEYLAAKRELEKRGYVLDRSAAYPEFIEISILRKEMI